MMQGNIFYIKYVLKGSKDKCSKGLKIIAGPWMLLFICSFVSNSFAAPWTEDCQAPLSTGFPRQEYWS